MADTTPHNAPIITEHSEAEKNRRGLLFRLSKGLLITCLAIIGTITFSSVLVLELKPVRQFVLGLVMDEVNESILGSIHIRDFELFWDAGLEIRSIVVQAEGGDTVAIIPKITLNPDMQALSRQTISVGCIAIHGATIRLIRNRDSVWNIERIVAPTSDTTTGKPFDWDITLGSLELRDCSILRYDSTAVRPPFRSAFMFDQMRLEQMNCTVSGGANIAKQHFDIALSNLSFVEVMSGFTLHNLGCDAHISQSTARLQNVHVRTPNTDLSLNAFVLDNIFKGFNPDSTQILLDIDATKFYGNDLCAFLPYANFTGVYGMTLKAHGTLNDLTVSTIKATTEHSFLKAEGRLRNITKGDQLSFEAWLEKSAISYDEVRNNAIVLQLPALDFIGVAKISKGYIYGFPKDSIYIDVQPISTRSGSVSGKLSLYLRDTLGYNADIAYSALNLAPIVHSQSVESSLNGRMQTRGKGFSLQELATEMHIQSQRSHFAGRYFSHLDLKASCRNGGFIVLDTIRLGLADSTVADSVDVFSGDTYSFLQGSGNFDFRDLNYPLSKFNSTFTNIDVGHLAADPDLDLLLSGALSVDVQGTHIDSLTGVIEADMQQFLLKDRALMPFTLSCIMKRQNYHNRSIRVRSTPFDADINGDFSILGLVQRVTGNITSIVDNATKKTNTVRGISVPDQVITPPTQEVFLKPVNAQFFIECRDLSPVELFVPDITLDIRGKIKGKIKGDRNFSDINIDTVSCTSLHIKTADNDIRSENISASFQSRMFHEKDTSTLEFISVTLRVDTALSVNDLHLYSPSLYLMMRKNKADVFVGADIAHQFTAQLRGILSVEEYSLGFILSSLQFTFGEHHWNATTDIIGQFSTHGLLLKQCFIQRNGGEILRISGLASTEKFNNLNVGIYGFDLPDIITFPFIDGSVKSLLQTLEGKIDSLVLTANGKFSNPDMTLQTAIKKIKYNNVYVGDQVIHAESKDSVITGELRIVNSLLQGNPTTMTIRVNALPLNIALQQIENRWSKTKPIDIEANAKELSLATVAPFIPGVTKVQGLGDAQITVKGIVGDKLDYGGTVRFYKASFVTLSSNILYKAAGKMTLRNNTVTIDTVLVANDGNDYPKGRASLTGSVLVDGFSIEYLDIIIRSPELMVLSPASEATMPTMYGKFVIASGKNPIHLRGTLDKPVLTGDIVVKDADITMPPDKKFQKKISVFRYEKDTVSGKHTYSIKTVNDTSAMDKPPQQTATKKGEVKINASIVDKMKYDMNILIVPNKFKLTMILGNFERLIAYVNPKDKNVALLFRREPFGQFQMFGELVVQDKSTYEFVKTLSAGGSVNFETGQLDNPRMNLTAILRQKRTFDSKQQEYTVEVKIEGTKKEPIVSFSYAIDKVPGTGSKEELTENALMLLVFGRTKAELFGSQSSGQGGSLVGDLSGSASSLITSQLGSLLQGTFIREATINFDGNVGDISNANVSLAGQIVGDVQWRVGGSIGDLASNNNFSIDIPLSAFFDKGFLDNVVLQLTTSAVNNNASANALRQQKLWEVKLGWRYTF